MELAALAAVIPPPVTTVQKGSFAAVTAPVP